MRKYSIFILFLLGIITVQANRLDSLRSLWQDESKPDSIRIPAMNQYIWSGYVFRDTDSALLLVDELLEWTERVGSDAGFASASNVKAVVMRTMGRYDEALELYHQNLPRFEKLSNHFGVASTYNNIGLIHWDQGDHPKAIESFIRAITKCESVGDTNSVASPMNNIALIYLGQGDVENARAYFQKCEKIYARMGIVKGVAVTNQNLGTCEFEEGDYDEAMVYFRKGEEAAKASDQHQALVQIYLAMCRTLYNQALAFEKEGNLSSKESKLKESLIYVEKALEIAERIGLPKELADGYIKAGYVYDALGSKSRGIEYGRQGLQIGRELKSNVTIRDASQLLYKLYKQSGDNNAALAMHELYMSSRDSVETAENAKETLRQQMQYEYDKERAVTEAAHESELQHINDLAELDRARHQLINVSIGAGLLLLALVLVFVFYRYRSTRKQKEVTELQKLQVEEKNREITASITYAKRIQRAILPNTKLVKEHLADSFIYYRPKDIVAGDFYWMDTVPGKCLFAAADCTGHGVPGAMVSVVCHNALNRSVREFGLSDPGEILNKTRELVVEHFEESEDQVKDGMDIALCSLEGNTLKFAGANNPLWVVSRNRFDADSELLIEEGEQAEPLTLYEFKGDKQPIGEHISPQPFVTRTLNLTSGDTLYIFTDGFADQFGGAKGKKFKYRQLKELIGSSSHMDMDKQSVLLNEKFENWMGELEQIDDVCVIGIRV